MEAEFASRRRGIRCSGTACRCGAAAVAGAIELIAALSGHHPAQAATARAGATAHATSLSEVGIASVRDGRIQRANDARRSWPWLAGRGPAGRTLPRCMPIRLTTHAAGCRNASCARRGAGAVSCSCASATARHKGCSLACAWAARRACGGLLPPASVNVDARHRASWRWRCRPSASRAILDRCWWASSPVGANGIEG